MRGHRWSQAARCWEKEHWFCDEDDCGAVFTRDGKMPRVDQRGPEWQRMIASGLRSVRRPGTIGCPIRGDLCWSCNRYYDKLCEE